LGAVPLGDVKFGLQSFCRMSASSPNVGELHIYDAIGRGFFFDGITASSIVKALEGVKDCKELHVRINSPGGDVFEGVAIYNAIKRFPAPKTCFVDGVAASMASIIALAGDRVETAANGMWMIHEPSGGAIGRADDLRKAAERIEAIRAVMVDTYVERTGQKREDVEAWMAAETWMDAKLAKERGFTNDIAGEERATAFHAGFSILAEYRNTPESLRAAAMAASAPPPPAAPAVPKENTAMLKFLIAALGLTETASEADVQTALTKHMQASRTAGEQLASVLAPTGKGSADEAAGVIAAWKAGAEQTSKLSAELAELKAAAEKTERDALVAKALADGKLTPAMAEKWAPTQSIAGLRAYLETAPKLVAEPKKEPGVTASALTPAQAEVYKVLGVDPNPKAGA
jgi:ATP-dependent Clp protease, protease subunit